MWGRGCVLFFIIISFVTCPVYAQTVENYSTILKKGERAVDSGSSEEALELWSVEANRPENKITDPRIGRSYIELVTQEERKELYDRAVQLYYWGLQNPANSVYEEELSDEIKRLQPIVNRKQYKRWRKLLKNEQYRKLGHTILRFWKWLDPTVETTYNERLIEHWRRIAYGRENFTRNGISVYDADERAEIYVKYGEPDLIRDGMFHFSSGLVRSWIQQAFQINYADVGNLPQGSDSVSRGYAKQIMRARISQMQGRVTEYERKIRFQHTYPSYEIWVYEDILKNNFTPVIFVFGEEGGTSQFELLRSVEDMMPNSAFRNVGLQMEIPPSFFLQLMYYQNLVTVDNYFERAYQQLQSKLYSMQGVSSWDSRMLYNQNKSKLVMAQMKAPQERSTLGKEFPQISMDVHQYRLLNEDNEPYLATYVLSNPYRAYFVDQLNEDSFNLDAYNLTGSVMGVDENNEIIFRKSTKQQRLREIQGFYGNIERVQPEVSYFEVANATDLANQKFTVQLVHKNKDSTRIGDGVFKENIRAVGNLSKEQPEPLSLEDSELQMGDLILGVRQDATDKSLPFGFRVEPDATIDQGENLIVHLEVYNLEGSSSEIEPFQIEYVAIEKMGLFKRIFNKREKVRLSLNFESTGSQFRENLEIDTSPFEPGEYKLELTAMEPGTEREVTRSVEFVIEETKETN